MSSHVSLLFPCWLLIFSHFHYVSDSRNPPSLCHFLTIFISREWDTPSEQPRHIPHCRIHPDTLPRCSAFISACWERLKKCGLISIIRSKQCSNMTWTYSSQRDTAVWYLRGEKWTQTHSLLFKNIQNSSGCLKNSISFNTQQEKKINSSHRIYKSSFALNHSYTWKTWEIWEYLNRSLSHLCVPNVAIVINQKC